MEQPHEKRFPGESNAYREERDKLLVAETELRKRLEEVAALRRSLPPGRPLKEDYLFEEITADEPDQETIRQTRFSELFDTGKHSLVIYSLMYAPDATTPCPMCTSILDGLDGSAPHIRERMNLVVAAKAAPKTLRDWARERDWKHLRLVSSGGNSYNADYFAETPEGAQLCQVARHPLHRMTRHPLHFVIGFWS